MLSPDPNEPMPLAVSPIPKGTTNMHELWPKPAKANTEYPLFPFTHEQVLEIINKIGTMSPMDYLDMVEALTPKYLKRMALDPATYERKIVKDICTQRYIMAVKVYLQKIGVNLNDIVKEAQLTHEYVFLVQLYYGINKESIERLGKRPLISPLKSPYPTPVGSTYQTFYIDQSVMFRRYQRVTMLDRLDISYESWDHRENIHGTCFFHCMSAVTNMPIFDIAIKINERFHDPDFYKLFSHRPREDLVANLSDNSGGFSVYEPAAFSAMTAIVPTMAFVVFCTEKNKMCDKLPVNCYYNFNTTIESVAFMHVQDHNHVMVMSIAPRDNPDFLKRATYTPAEVQWLAKEGILPYMCKGIFVKKGRRLGPGIHTPLTRHGQAVSPDTSEENNVPSVSPVKKLSF